MEKTYKNEKLSRYRLPFEQGRASLLSNYRIGHLLLQDLSSRILSKNNNPEIKTILEYPEIENSRNYKIVRVN